MRTIAPKDKCITSKNKPRVGVASTVLWPQATHTCYILPSILNLMASLHIFVFCTELSALKNAKASKWVWRVSVSYQEWNLTPSSLVLTLLVCSLQSQIIPFTSVQSLLLAWKISKISLGKKKRKRRNLRRNNNKNTRFSTLYWGSSMQGWGHRMENMDVLQWCLISDWIQRPWKCQWMWHFIHHFTGPSVWLLFRCWEQSTDHDLAVPNNWQTAWSGQTRGTSCHMAVVAIAVVHQIAVVAIAVVHHIAGVAFTVVHHTSCSGHLLEFQANSNIWWARSFLWSIFHLWCNWSDHDSMIELVITAGSWGFQWLEWKCFNCDMWYLFSGWLAGVFSGYCWKYFSPGKSVPLYPGKSSPTPFLGWGGGRGWAHASTEG